MQLSDWCKEIFKNEAFAERIANTLNFVLKHLVGPECSRVQIKDPESVSFKPAILLHELCTIYTNLQEIEYFCISVVKDERSFKPEYINQALRRLKISKMAFNQQKLEEFIKRVQHFSQQASQLEEILGNDAPEEFICTISCDLMREPVLLPTSGNVCDLNTMKRILLNDEHDPFNRAPLKLSDLKELHELKGRIDHWIAQKKAGISPTDEDLRKLNGGNEEMKQTDDNDTYFDISPGHQGGGLQITMSQMNAHQEEEEDVEMLIDQIT